MLSRLKKALEKKRISAAEFSELEILFKGHSDSKWFWEMERDDIWLKKSLPHIVSERQGSLLCKAGILQRQMNDDWKTLSAWGLVVLGSLFGSGFALRQFGVQSNGSWPVWLALGLTTAITWLLFNKVYKGEYLATDSLRDFLRDLPVTLGQLAIVNIALIAGGVLLMLLALPAIFGILINNAILHFEPRTWYGEALLVFSGPIFFLVLLSCCLRIRGWFEVRRRRRRN